MAKKIGFGKGKRTPTDRAVGRRTATPMGPAVTRPQARTVSNYPMMPQRPLGKPTGPVMGPIQGSPAINPFAGMSRGTRGPFRRF